MKRQIYKTVGKNTKKVEYKIKGSKFIGFVFQVENIKQINEYLNQIKENHFKANHHCYAYQLRSNEFRYSDDNEPSNTAGKPIYDIVGKYNIVNVLLVVVRYFGGIQLGTGGLMKAYGHTANLVIKHNKILEKSIIVKIGFEYDYDYISVVQLMIDKYNLNVINQEYNNKIEGVFEINKGYIDNFSNELKNKTNGDVIVKNLK